MPWALEMPMAVWWLASNETASALLRAEAANCRAAVLSMFVCVEDWGSGAGALVVFQSWWLRRRIRPRDARDDPMSPSGLASCLLAVARVELGSVAQVAPRKWIGRYYSLQFKPKTMSLGQISYAVRVGG